MRDVGQPEIIVFLAAFVLFGFALFLLTRALRSKQGRLVQRALIDKLASGNDLATFLQTPAGDRFLRGITSPESPVQSIMSSVQSGIVVFVVGLGISIMGGNVPPAVRSIGFLLISLGAGLLIAAFVSYRVSRHWQLLEKEQNPR